MIKKTLLGFVAVLITSIYLYFIFWTMVVVSINCYYLIKPFFQLKRYSIFSVLFPFDTYWAFAILCYLASIVISLVTILTGCVLLFEKGVPYNIIYDDLGKCSEMRKSNKEKLE